MLFGVVRNNGNEKKIELNLLPNYKKDILFNQLPYIAQLENHIFKEIMRVIWL